ncbi:MAG: hypothetical protein AAFN11_02695 [Chloroflexota bacterium]
MYQQNPELVQALIDILTFQKHMMENTLLEDENAWLASHKKSSEALFTILEAQQNPDTPIEWRVEYGDNESRLDLMLSIRADVVAMDDLPDYLPRDIFAQLKRKETVDEMMALLRSYKMPAKDIKPFLRRIFPADDAL